ncbi:MAG TPA: protein kinase [Kofleriaceae bacterium]|jgi:serine/threonine protein kinase/tetratricopeptide (TPR) repeat protein
MQPGDLVAGRFRLEAMAGTGGMGAVYRAIDQAANEAVAIKVLRADSVDHVDRFAREIRVLEQLRHPGIVRYVADGVAHGELWLAMEWLDGESLSHRLRSGVTAAEAIDLTRRVAEALGAAHALGVVHRDVKPGNIFLPNGRLDQVKVLDFGVARVAAGDRFATRTGVMIGTPGYMAPEQARGDRDVGSRADVFALGCVLFEALTGTPPFAGDHVMAVLAKILLEQAPRLADVRPEIPRDLDQLVARCLAKLPEERPSDGSELAQLLAGLGQLATLTEMPPRERPALTRAERKILCVVLIGGGGDAFDTLADSDLSMIPTTSQSSGMTGGDTQVLLALRGVAYDHGGALERLVDGSHVVTVAGSGTAADQAAQAARCALALKVIAPTAPIALATGRAVMAGRWPVGEVIDRAAKLLDADGLGVRIDDVTAGLLDARFQIAGDGDGLYVTSEHDAFASTRTLLGKPTPCVGRDRELGVLVGLYDECVAEPMARAVLVTGAAGIGKSRVRHELGLKIVERGEPFELWLGRGDPLRAGSPYGILAPALRRAAGIQDGEPLDVRRQKLRARVMRNASTEPSTTIAFLGELIGTPFEPESIVVPTLAAAHADPLIMAEQIRRAFEHFIAIETAVQPLAIVLEDVHWADVSSMKLVDAALRGLHDRPLFVLALARPDVHERFPRLWAERGVQELRLDELTKKGSERLVRRVLETASDTLVARIVEQAGGNAFYLEELIRAAAEGKGNELPETVLASVQSRLERLELDARHVLRAASVFGQRFWRGGVVELVGASGDHATNSWLDELVQRELLARGGASRFPGQEELRFRHALVREAAYAMLTDADKRLGHELAGAWLARVGEVDPMVLGEHAEQAGDDPRAAELYRAAAEQALAACDFAGASARAEQAFGCGAKGATRGAVRLVQAESRRWLGEFAQALRCATDAMELLLSGSAAWFAAANEAGESAGRIDDVAGLERLAAALHATSAIDHAALGPRVTAIANLAFQLFTHGRSELAIALLDDVDQLAVGVTEPAILARIYQARSSRSMFTGDAGAYLESEQAAAAAFERAGDLRYACVQRGNVGYACLEIGAYAEAERALRDALDQATRLGLSNVIATTKHNLGRALMMRGALDEALRIETEAFEAFAAQGDRRMAGAARVYRAAILAERDELGAAEGELLGALEHAQPPLQAQIRGMLARILRRAGRIDEALVHARGAYELLERLGAIEEGEAVVRLALAEALEASGDRTGSQTVLAAARQRVLDRAARISDPEHRRRFLSQVPEHVATLGSYKLAD